MKVILSRKGFDTNSGGIPSPILSDGRMLSLPIPYRFSPVTYSDVCLDSEESVVHLIECLSRSSKPSWDGKIRLPLGGRKYALVNVKNQPCHLDPDLRYNSRRTRPPGWMPAFGQVGNSETTLSDLGVGKGDVFLFFGNFRRVHRNGEAWSYDKLAPVRHVIFGWLQVEEKVNATDPEAAAAKLPWLVDHPHLKNTDRWVGPNSVYLPSDRLNLQSGESFPVQGGGLFRFHEDLVLTATNESPSIWRLPDWASSSGNSYFAAPFDKPEYARAENGRLIFNTGRFQRWQELVIMADRYRLLEQWIDRLMSHREDG